MAVIANDSKTMRKVEEEEIERYAAIAKSKQGSRSG
jgi:hypothetical protein